MSAPTLSTRSPQETREIARAPIKPDVYIATSWQRSEDNLRVLDLLQGSFMGEGKEHQFLDLGCGTGDFTRDHLLPRCPEVERIIAVDVSPDMLEYAKEHFAHPKICYDVLDISGDGVPGFVQRHGQFDRVYSFYCLNWIKDQGTGFKNIAELMKPGGGCLLYFIASSITMRFRKKLAAMTHWQKYRKTTGVS